MSAPTDRTYIDPAPNVTGGGFELYNSSSLWVFYKDIIASTTAAIFGSDEWSRNTVEVNGNVKSSGQHRGIKLEGNHSTVRIGQYGTVDGGTIAVEMTGDHSELINYGTIKGSSPGASIYIAGGSYAGFVNHGIVTAITSMEGDHQGGGDQVVVHLGPTSNLQDYLEILSDQGDTATILNEGYMRASTGLAAFEGGVETRLSPTKGQSKGGSCSGRATTPSSIKAIVLRLALCIAT